MTLDHTIDDADSSSYVLAIGASAGGLAALETFFSHMPSESDLSVIILIHMSIGQGDYVKHALENATSMPIVLAENGGQLKPNQVVLVPDKFRTILHRC